MYQKYVLMNQSINYFNYVLYVCGYHHNHSLKFKQQRDYEKPLDYSKSKFKLKYKSFSGRRTVKTNIPIN